jgi:predicted amidophosphoribosyltransferase
MLKEESWRKGVRASCPECNAPLPDNKAKFCQECGAKLQKDIFCTGCGAKLEPGVKFCGECGTRAQ